MFYKFPHTPHLAWLGKMPCRDDKVMSVDETRAFLDYEIMVEEKVDGTNLGFSVSEDGQLRVQNRGHYLTRGEHPQFQPLWPWMETRQFILREALKPGLMLFGEWCFAHHSVPYERLPDWFLGFDVFDRATNRFWSSGRRDNWLTDLGLSPVPRVAQARFTLDQVISLMGSSNLGANRMEGIYLRREQGEWLEQRAKLVRPEFVEAIEKHWSKEALIKNSLSH